MTGAGLFVGEVSIPTEPPADSSNRPDCAAWAQLDPPMLGVYRLFLRREVDAGILSAIGFHRRE